MHYVDRHPLKVLRRNLRIQLYDVSRGTGIPTWMISDFEEYSRLPTLKELVMLMQYYSTARSNKQHG